MYQKFARSFYLTEFIALGFGFPVAAGYVLLLLNLSLDNMVRIALFATATALAVEVFLAWPTNFWVSKKARQGVRDWEAGNRTGAEAFYRALVRLPLDHAILVFGRITLGSLVCVGYMGTLGISPAVLAMSVVLSAYGSYLAAIVSYQTTVALVSPFCQELVSQGVPGAEALAHRHWFSLSVKQKIIFSLLVPILVTNLSIFFSVYSSWEAGASYPVLMLHVVGDIVVSIFTLLIFLIFSLRMIGRPLGHLVKSLTALAEGRGGSRDRIPTDLLDDFAYISHLINQSLDQDQSVILKLKSASAALNDSIQELNVSSQEISATSNQQAAGVKEIVATMEDSDQLSKRIASQATEVAKIAKGNVEVVNTGVSFLNQSLEKMEAIKEANTTSIQGIRTLGDKIANIWDIVNIINTIADQTKIIAFNAELEAASAGEAGRNFQIVATEIRRLADGTVDSTKEIRARINEIQNSSDHLILASEEGTAKIVAGWELSGRLRALFEDIRSTSEISADSATKIAGSIGQQVSAFDQILTTLKQISSGIDHFVTATASTSRLSKVLMDMSKEIHEIVARYDEVKD